MNEPLHWGSADLDDDNFVRAFEICEYPNEKFKHGDHIRLAWIYVRRYGAERAEERIASSIRRFAMSVGHEAKFHLTMTRAWLRLVAVAHCASPLTDDFTTFSRQHGWLMDKRALGAFYSQALLESDPARERWVEPDLRPLPVLGRG